MRSLEWRRGKTGKPLADLWGVSEAAVRRYAAEASRIVRSEVQDPEEVGRTVCAALEQVLREAVADKDRRNAIQAAQVWATISGAKAAERLDINAGVAASPADARRIMREQFGEVTPAAEGENEKGESDGGE